MTSRNQLNGLAVRLGCTCLVAVLACSLPQMAVQARPALQQPSGSGSTVARIPLRGPRVQFDVTINGEGPFLFGFDTGASASVPLRGPLRSSGKVASSLGEFELFRGELAGELKIGAFTFPQPVVFFSDFVTAPNVGRNIIRTFAVTFDQRNRRVGFARP